MDITLDRREDHHPFRRLTLDLFHIRFEILHGGFHRFGRLKHKRQLHLSRSEEFADHLHPVEQENINDI